MLWPWISELQVLGHTGVDDKHKACFASDSARDAYFLSKVLSSPANLNSYTQLNTEKPIMVEGSYEDLLAADMITFINHNLGNKRMYARIMEKNWVNTNCTRLSVEIDAYTTFMNDITFDGCFVEREMQSGDWAGDAAGSWPTNVNLNNEPFAVNAQTASESFFKDFIRGRPMIVIAASVEADKTTPIPGREAGGVYSGAGYTYCSGPGEANAVIAEYAEQGSLDAIFGVFMVPQSLENASSEEISLPPQPSAADGYTPQNAKVLCWPYTYLELYSPNTNPIQLNYALFDDPQSPKAKVYFVPHPTPGYLVVPMDYRGMNEDEASALWIDACVQCIWAGSDYQNWVAQNTQSSIWKVIGGGLAAAGGAAIAAATGIVSVPAGVAALAAGGASVLSGTANVIAQEKAVQGHPATPRGSGSGPGYLFMREMFGVYTNVITPTRSEAMRLDSAFKGLGYNTQMTKTPNIRTRPHWNYVKTLNANVSGNLTASWIEQIESLLNNGVTFWHVDQGAQIGNYNMGN